MRVYAVIDTNVLVSSMLSRRADSPTVRVFEAVADGVIVPLYNEEILCEYEDVLLRPKFPFEKEHVRETIDTVKRLGISVDPLPTGELLPDMDDLVFYEVVMEKRDDGAYLVTGNTRHFPERSYIVTPAEMMEIIDSRDSSS